VAALDMPQLSVAAVARKLGIAPATLRTWDRRYGIGPAHHAPGEHRRYSVDDVARLELMRDALLHGATPAAAARYALSTPLPHSDPTTPPPIADTDETTLQTRWGGPGLPLPDAGWHARGLARAATALDADAVRRLLNESIAAVGAQITWDLAVRPVLVAIAQRWADTGTGIEIEHLLSDCVTGVFSALAASTPTTTARPVLLAGMAGDQHQLPIVVLAATLAQRGVTCRSLGTDLPADALFAAIRRTAPAALLLWSQLSDTADPDLLTSLPRTRPGFRIFIGGPGWADVTVGPRVVRLSSLHEATDAISAVASAPPLLQPDR
jgi:MerR family transcriptional regulator, light-induced transcriptional regulator